MGESRWMTIKEAAEYTRTDEDWILEHIRSGALRYVPTARRSSPDTTRGPKRRIVDRLKVDVLMERLEVAEMVAASAAEPEARPAPARPVAADRKLSYREQVRRDLGR